MNNLKPLKLIAKLGGVCGTIGVAIALAGGFDWMSRAEAIGFNFNSNGGFNLQRNVWGPGVTPPPSDPSNGDITTLSETTATIFGPANGSGDISYIDWYLTAPTNAMLSINFKWSYSSNDGAGDDFAGVFTQGAYDQNAAICNDGYDNCNVVPRFTIDDQPNNPSSNVLVSLQSEETLVFRVYTLTNNGSEGSFKITDFDVQYVPFDFAPTYGVIFVGTALGINEWRKKRQASKKDETEEKL
jgi:hypothetical protein